MPRKKPIYIRVSKFFILYIFCFFFLWKFVPWRMLKIVKLCTCGNRGRSMPKFDGSYCNIWYKFINVGLHGSNKFLTVCHIFIDPAQLFGGSVRGSRKFPFFPVRSRVTHIDVLRADISCVFIRDAIGKKCFMQLHINDLLNRNLFYSDANICITKFHFNFNWE